MSKHVRRKALHTPATVFILPDQQPLFPDPPSPDPKIDATRRAVLAELDRIGAFHRREVDRIMQARMVVAGDMDALDTTVSAGEQAARRGYRPWRLRIGSNMDMIASMLEDAGRDGVTEAVMVERLQQMGRLATAEAPKGSVHWTVTELRRRTMHCVRKSGRWYAYGPFDQFRRRTA